MGAPGALASREEARISARPARFFECRLRLRLGKVVLGKSVCAYVYISILYKDKEDNIEEMEQICTDIVLYIHIGIYVTTVHILG